VFAEPTFSLENGWMRGSKYCGQGTATQTPAHIMTRPWSNGHNHFVPRQGGSFSDKLADEQNMGDQKD
jgi:hypothetical protein